MPTRQVKRLKPGDRVILESGQVQVKAIHLLSAEAARIEWHGTIDARTEYHPGESLQVLAR